MDSSHEINECVAGTAVDQAANTKVMVDETHLGTVVPVLLPDDITRLNLVTEQQIPLFRPRCQHNVYPRP